MATITIDKTDIQDFLDQLSSRDLMVTEFQFSNNNQYPDVSFDLRKNMEYELEDYVEIDDLRYAQEELKEALRNVEILETECDELITKIEQQDAALKAMDLILQASVAASAKKSFLTTLKFWK